MLIKHNNSSRRLAAALVSLTSTHSIKSQPLCRRLQPLQCSILQSFFNHTFWRADGQNGQISVIITSLSKHTSLASGIRMCYVRIRLLSMDSRIGSMMMHLPRPSLPKLGRSPVATALLLTGTAGETYTFISLIIGSEFGLYSIKLLTQG